MPLLHATAFLKSPGDSPTGPVAVLFGSQRHLLRQAFDALRSQVLSGDEENEISLTRFAGKETEWKTVRDELRTVSMWGDVRLVVVEEADTFVTAHRASLEQYVKSPSKKSVLVLSVKSWPKNTRLAKMVAQDGLTVECSELKGTALMRWLSDCCLTEHDKQITRDAAALTVEMAGTDLGLLSQELAKAAAYVGTAKKITVDDVRAVVGGWATKTAFNMIDALIGGRLNQSLTMLDKLLSAGESPHRILGAIGFSFRRIAAAVEAARHGVRLKDALAKTGIFANRIGESASHLRRIGRPQAEKIHAHLLQADSQLKGGSRISERVALEQLLVRLSGRSAG